MNRKRLISALLLCSMVVFPTASFADQIIIGNGQTVTVDSISDSSAPIGGAVYVEAGGTLNTTAGSKFENNISTNPYDGGGAIYNTGGTVNINNNVQFNNNHIDRVYNEADGMSAGGAIASWNSGSVIIDDDVIFNHNGYNSEDYSSEPDTPSWTSGGAIYTDTNWQSQASLTIGKGVEFTENAGGMAGALYMGGTHATIGDGAVFEDNSSSYGNGGAVYIYGGPGVDETTQQMGSDVSFGTTTFESNDSGWKGGAVYNYGDAETSFGDKSQFIGNSASYNGGAIFNSGRVSADDYKATITATNATFSGNHADGDGGAIYNTIDNLTSGTLTAEQYQNNAVIDVSGTFENNSAEGMGGAIFNEGTANVSNATFIGNSAVNGGGAFYNTSTASANLEGVMFQAGNDTVGNDIFNAGSIATTGTNTFASDIYNAETGNIEFNEQNTIAQTSSVSGKGSIVNNGTVNLAGNASGYTGKYSHDSDDAVTTVTGAFYGGESTIEKGTLNWNTTNNPQTGTLKVTGDDTNLNIGTNSTATTQAIGDLVLGTDSSISAEVNTIINSGSSLTLNGGKATLNSDDTWSGTINLSNADSTLTIDNIKEDYTGILNATNGTLDFSGGKFTLNSGSSIEKAVNIVIDQNETFVIKEGVPVTIDNDDEWLGTVSLEGGTLNVSGREEQTTSNGILQTTTGNLNIIDNGDLDIASNSVIKDAVITNIEAGSTLTVKGGETTLNTGDTWAGTVNLTGGKLTVNSVTNGAIYATGGNLILESQNFNVATGSVIEAAVTTSIDENSTLTVNGGTATLNTGDTWNGGVTLNSGTLNIDNSGNIQNSTIQANDGALNITGGTVNVGEGSAIQNEVALNVANNTGIDITTGGVVGVNDNDTLAGTTILNGGTLNYGITNPTATNITANTGYLNLLEDSVLAIQNPSNIADAVVVDIQKGSTLETNANTVFNLNGGNEDPLQNDKWNGLIRNWSGTVNVKEIVNNDTSALQQYGGETNIDSNSQIILDNQLSEVSGGVVNVKNNSTLAAIDASIMRGGDLNVDSTSKFISLDNAFSIDNLNHSGALIGQNNAIEDYTIASNMNIGSTGDNQADFTLDVYGRSNGEGYNDSDRFFADVLKNASDSESATVNIADWNLGGDIFGWDAPIDKHINLGRIFNYNTLEGNVNFTETDKEIFTPIGWYRLNNVGGAGGSYTMDLTRFNPQVYRGQVTTLAQWMNQLAIDDMLFNHSMLLPSFKEEDGGTAYSGMMANRYASTMPQYAPYQYSRKNGGLWCKMYGTFETLQMSQGLNNVGNNAYGTLIGADFGLKELKHGWKFMPTAYIGYNGAHQYYSGLGAYQNGGQAGFLGTWYKNNFIIGGLIYGGVYQNSLDIAGHTDNTFNYFAGAATKLAYNWRFHRDWVLQPNLFLAYNFFGQQNWHSDFGQMGMMSGLLNGINLAPGLNLIWEKETFSIYATLQYMYNLNGAVGGRAGNVDLPHLYMDRGYIQYGIGFTKRFTDRFSGYFQTVFRNVGRTGVGFQLGFNFLLGK